MSRKIFSSFICLVLLFSFIFTVSADTVEFVDVEGHWAESYIYQVSELGLFCGTGDGTTFSPDMSMNRAMFVTVLGRLANVDQSNWSDAQAANQFSDVAASAWYAPYVSWAVRNGVASGTGDGRFSPNMDITREQMAAFVSNFVMNLNCQIRPLTDTPYDQPFSDNGKISSWATDGVMLLQMTGIVSGIDNGDGTYRFNPKGKASRAECSTVFSKLHEALVLPSEMEEILPTSIAITAPKTDINKYGSVFLYAEVLPVEATNKTISWSSSNPEIVEVVADGTKAMLKWKSSGTATITAMTANGLTASVKVNALSNTDVAYAGESYSQKCNRIFGYYVSEPRLVYQTYDEASPHMATVQVKTWDLRSDGSKYTRTWSLTVHENIASTVEAIFEDLYALPSKPPVHSLGGFRIDGKSEHTVGLAIDINPNENPYCSPDGSVLVGSFFDPAGSEYSFAVGGEVEKIFNKYGFTRGIYWRSGYKDYMHFSYFGT